MKNRLTLLALISLACVIPSLTQSVPANEVTPISTAWPTAMPNVISLPTFTPTPQVTSTPSYQGLPVLLPDAIHIYPTDLFPNDYYSIDVAPQIPLHITQTLTLTVTFPDGTTQRQPLEAQGLDAVKRAQFIWVKQVPENSSILTLTYTIALPQDLFTNESETLTLTLPEQVLPLGLLPPPEPAARWTLTETSSFIVHYITGTRAERDLDAVVLKVDQAYNDIMTYFGKYNKPIDFYMLDRVIGQGGYASSEWVAISYPDRAYAPTELGSLLRHELTHRLDSVIGCAEAPAFLREGLAVYVAGGHYRVEPIVKKASTAMANGYMIPIHQLLTNFYIYQHEVSYLEAAAFVAFIHEQYGWQGIEILCKHASSTLATDLDKMNAAAQALAGMDMSNLVDHYTSWLNMQPVTPDDQELFEYELQLMDLLRLYQLHYDPAAHFLDGILFDPEQGVEQDIVADFVRGPISEEAIALELLLTAGQDALIQQDIAYLSTILNILEDVLEDGDNNNHVFKEVLDVVKLTIKYGYEPYHLTFLGGSQYEIAVLNKNQWPQASVLTISWIADRWIFTGAQ